MAERPKARDWRLKSRDPVPVEGAWVQIPPPAYIFRPGHFGHIPPLGFVVITLIIY